MDQKLRKTGKVVYYEKVHKICGNCFINNECETFKKNDKMVFYEKVREICK